LLLGCTTLNAGVSAAVTSTDVQIAARALSFMEKPFAGAVRVGILYAPSSPESVREAESLRDLLGAGMKIGKLELKPTLVKTSDAATANVDMYFLTEYVAAADASAAGIADSKRPCVTTDFAQVYSGACLMGVRSAPKVQILVNRDAAKDSGVEFATVFRVMITEI
jgi:ABC-type uncharacterized transport system substrate-binding protein